MIGNPSRNSRHAVKARNEKWLRDISTPKIPFHFRRGTTQRYYDEKFHFLKVVVLIGRLNCGSHTNVFLATVNLNRILILRALERVVCPNHVHVQLVKLKFN